ncbi:MAG TPA: glycosyltransferase family 2 protein [Myxococcaceae bacterium]|nr:glycosyltransferase family 2 protein [Myxococcaceae bacterium]
MTTCSVVVPLYNEEAVLPELYRRVAGVLKGAAVSYELVLVNDGSKDGTWALMKQLREQDPCVTLLNLSRNFGHQIAITAGIEHAAGDTVVIMDADLQDPPEVILEMLARWREGFDVVYGVRTRRRGDGWFKRATASLFYRVVRMATRVDIPVDTGDFRLISRRAVEHLKRLRETNRFVRGLVAWLGFRQVGLTYERAPRYAGQTKYPLGKMLRFAADAVASFSVAPLRLASSLGFLVSFGSFAYAAFAIYAKVWLGRTLQGWASLIVAVAFLGGVQLLCLGIVGEYLGRVYDEVKGRPLYVVQDFDAGTAGGRLVERDQNQAAAPHPPPEPARR